MKFSIDNGPVFTSLNLQLESGESIKADSGSMVAMSPTIELKAKTSGKGLMGTLKSAVGGEGLFMTEYTAETGPGELLLAPSFPGDVLPFQMNGQTMFAQSGAFMAGEKSLELSTQGSVKAMISGEGLFLQKITGVGNLFLNCYGSIIEKSLTAGEEYIVDTGHIVAFEETVTYKLKKAAKGIFNTLASGEGLVCRYSGPGKIWLQTRNMSALAKTLMPYFPGK
jgi:uncharacterized protein (TIGR00266 family)